MKIKEVCARTGLTERAIRFYITKGLLHTEVTERNGRNFRDYTESEIRTLQCLVTLRNAGFRIETIRQMQQQPNQIPELIAAYRKELQQGIEQEVAAAECLDALHGTPGNIEELAQELERQMRRRALPNNTLRCRFGALDEDTSLPPRSQGPRIKRWIALILAGIVAIALLAGGGLYWWESRMCYSITTVGSVSFDEKWLDEEGRYTVHMRLLLDDWNWSSSQKDKKDTVRTLHFAPDMEGYLLYRSLLLEEEYMSVTIQTACPRGEARRLGLLDENGFLKVNGIIADPSLQERYCTIIALQGE